MTAKNNYRFPFGQPVKNVVQKDRSPKKAFVLGVYASAVHAEWRDANGKLLVRALAVASEPEIFWRGDGVDKIIQRITLPEGVGMLAPAAGQYNGPSGRVLDDMILHPLGLTRDDVWLCDLVPQSRMNPGQASAMKRAYQKYVDKGMLPAATVPPLEPIDDNRRKAMLRELRQSQAESIILLGDEPIRQFLMHFVPGWSTLAAFTKNHTYGSGAPVILQGMEYEVCPLAHPRQIAKLGTSSSKWAVAHEKWMKSLRSPYQ